MRGHPKPEATQWGAEGRDRVGRDWEAGQEAIVVPQAGFSELQNQFGHRVRQVPKVGCCVVRGHQYRSQEKTWCWSAGAYPARSQGDNN